MKATPIAEFLARKSGEPGPRAAAQQSAFNPRKISPVNDDDEPEFRRSGLVAALAKRSPESPPLVRPMDAAAFAPRRDSPPPQPLLRQPPPPPEPAINIEEQLSEAYHRGVQQGLDAGKEEAATARAMERAELQKRAVIEKLDFQMNEYARLSESIFSGFAEMERRVAQAAAQLLKPLLVEAVSRQIVDELAENVTRLTRTGGIGLLKVRGPERLLSVLKPKIQELAVDVEYVEDSGVEITVAAQSTEIRSELGSWMQLIEDIIANG
jgi:hypothetical protein